ncbi:mercuric reductase [Mucilaginibacter sp. RS28]|uniref:Mercuric reductase n=1 Tax=Mucilaginibacter straminoryzae TaxID=2932774 RepID=A0A9X2B9B5_9SPHI|nr:mercuric reductase [Mucilaginibacter straminoryzae]MCJ8210434.1 mercuric reductase [Mucilaginibacter straminoryzae]
MKHYDAIVIGSGQAGSPLCKKLAKQGKKTALIERRYIGGTCVNDGCTPTKTWLGSAKAAYNAQHAKHVGVHVDGYHVDLKKIKHRKEEIVLKSRNGSLKSMEQTPNLDIYFAEASFTGHKTLKLKLNNGGEEELSADLIFINVGAAPAIPDIEGLKDIDYLTSTGILELEEIPGHLAILGGSYIALEFAQMFRRFGSKVTILERGPRIMSHEDDDIADEIARILREEEISILTDTHATRFSKDSEGITIDFKTQDQHGTLNATHVLVATGRKPQTEKLGMDKTGVTLTEKCFIPVNNKLETVVPGIYALGDVNGGPAFTHISYNDYTIVYRNLFEGANLTTTGRPVPYCMFTDPQLGRIGITEKQAREQGYNYKAVKLSMKHVARAVELGDTRGMMKAIVDLDTRKILGAAILGEEGGEVVSVLQMAMMGGITYDEIRYCVFAHPTYSESLNNLFMQLD